MSFIAAAAGLGGTLASAWAQERTNDANREIAEQATWANAEQADKNRKWQEEMSNTAHQREMADLVKAGINPLLTATQSGASTPSGGVGSAVSATMENSLQGLGAAASDAVRLKQAIDKQKTDVEATKQSTETNKKQGELLDAQKNKTKTENNLLKANEPIAKAKNEITGQILERVGSSAKSWGQTPAGERQRGFDHKSYQKKMEQKWK